MRSEKKMKGPLSEITLTGDFRNSCMSFENVLVTAETVPRCRRVQLCHSVSIDPFSLRETCNRIDLKSSLSNVNGLSAF